MNAFINHSALSAHAAVSDISSCCLSVFLSQSQSQGGQELVQRHMDLRGEQVGVLDGHDHKDAVGDDLRRADNHTSVTCMWFHFNDSMLCVNGCGGAP